MTNDQPNPYATPAATNVPLHFPGDLDPTTITKIEAVVKDAGQFWLAILMCFVCTGWGALVIGPWYLVRLLQWNRIAQSHPDLLHPNALQGSIAKRFQSAKTKLIIGMSFGAVTLLFAIVVVAFLFVAG